MPLQMQMQMMQQHEGPFFMDPFMMQQQMQMGLGGIHAVPGMHSMGIGGGMNVGMGMGLSAADGTGSGGGMGVSGMQIPSIPINNFGAHQPQPQFQQQFSAGGDGGPRVGASGANPTRTRDILSATPMRQLQLTLGRPPSSGSGGGTGMIFTLHICTRQPLFYHSYHNINLSGIAISFKWNNAIELMD